MENLNAENKNEKFSNYFDDSKEKERNEMDIENFTQEIEFSNPEKNSTNNLLGK